MPLQPQVTVLIAAFAVAAAAWLAFLLAAAAWTTIARHASAARELRATPPGGLAPRAGALIVRADDVLDAAARDAGLAEAEFGEEAARPFREALERARAAVAEAFRLQHAGDDTALAEAVRRCERARTELESHAARFEELRARVRHAPELAHTAEEELAAVRSRVSRASGTLARLRDVYAAGTLAAIVDAPERARERLRRASACVHDAQRAMRTGDAGVAAALLGRAEEAIGDARRLLDAVEETAGRLEAQRERLTVGLAEMRPADARLRHG